MGRKKKFGEESDFVSVRVPKSQRKEYREAIKDYVEKKFNSSHKIPIEEKIPSNIDNQNDKPPNLTEHSKVFMKERNYEI